MSGNFGESLKFFYEAYIAASKAVGEESFSSGYVATFFHGTFEGLNVDEIEAIRAAQNVAKLPRIYTEFLRVMGRKSGGMFTGCDVDFPAPLRLKQSVFAMIEENREENPNIPLLPDDVVVFYGCQDASFCYFRTARDTEDPAVYYYVDGATKSYSVSPSLSKWLLQQVFDPEARGQFLMDIDMLRSRTAKGS